MVRTAASCLTDQRGAEALEWVAVGGGILAVAIAAYPGVLQTGLDAVLAAVTAKFLAL